MFYKNIQDKDQKSHKVEQKKATKTTNELSEKCLLMYKDKNEENLILSKMYNMFDNFNDKKRSSILA